MHSNPEQLTCVSMIICDEIYRDEHTKKLVIIGTFNRIQSDSVPCTHKKMTVLFSLTNGKGEYDFALSIEHKKTGRKVVEIRGPLAIEDPLIISDINLELRDLLFHHPGKYWVTLEADGALLQQRPFMVDVAPPQDSEKDT